MLDELEASRASRKRAWENLQELRWVLKDVAGIELPPPARKTIDLEGWLVKDGVHKAVLNRQIALSDLVHAIREYRLLADNTPLMLQGADYAHAIQELNEAIDRAESLCSNDFPSDAKTRFRRHIKWKRNRRAAWAVMLREPP
jgi:hypothetical protein